MRHNPTDYFAYKKNKIQLDIEPTRKPISRLNFLFQIFIATFIIFFIVIVVFIMKYSSKMDIEYTKGDLSYTNMDTINKTPSYSEIGDDEQKRIDKRLILIQQEENAPSEAKILNREKKFSQIIDPVHIEKNKKIDKISKQKHGEIILEEVTKKTVKEVEKEIKKQEKIQENNQLAVKNVLTLSKVLVGRYSSFEEAQKVQNAIKAKDSSLTPFVRKVGEVFSVQLGSYQDFNTAKTQAQILKSKGFDVWIYQQ